MAQTSFPRQMESRGSGSACASRGHPRSLREQDGASPYHRSWRDSVEATQRVHQKWIEERLVEQVVRSPCCRALKKSRTLSSSCLKSHETWRRQSDFPCYRSWRKSRLVVFSFFGVRGSQDVCAHRLAKHAISLVTPSC